MVTWRDLLYRVTIMDCKENFTFGANVNDEKSVGVDVFASTTEVDIPSTSSR